MRKYSELVLVLSLTVFLGVAAKAADKHQHHHGVAGNPVLTEAGNDAFGTLQEVVDRLVSDPDTDWDKVNLEALREHLVDMDLFTKQVTVVSQRKIKHGTEIVVLPDNEKAAQSLARAMSAHPAMVEQETGWDMQVAKQDQGYRLTVTSEKRKDAKRIRGLGYIGIMALGQHHQAHHWMIANGADPHTH